MGTIYVATTANGGSDSNDGLTKRTPKATFRQAIIAVDDGGTIEIIDSGDTVEIIDNREL